MATVKTRHSMNSVHGQNLFLFYSVPPWIVSSSGDAIKFNVPGHYLRNYGMHQMVPRIRIALMCWASVVLLDKIFPHISHPSIFFSSCPDKMWLANLGFFLKFDLMDFSTSTVSILLMIINVYHTGGQLSNWLSI